jgi:hypothetical protein
MFWMLLPVLWEIYFSYWATAYNNFVVLKLRSDLAQAVEDWRLYSWKCPV